MIGLARLGRDLSSVHGASNLNLADALCGGMRAENQRIRCRQEEERVWTRRG